MKKSEFEQKFMIGDKSFSALSSEEQKKIQAKNPNAERKANSSGKPWDTISVFRKGERKAIDFIKNKDARVKTV